MKKRMKQDEAAYRIWPVLVALARREGKITYSALADEIGSVDHRHGWPLGLIQTYCLAQDLPPLTILVVSKATGLPGHGFTALGPRALQTGYQSVWGHRWGQENPFAYAATGASLAGLTDRLCRQPEAAAEIYGLVKTRGMAQTVFRNAVLQAYDFQCAVCGVSHDACLEAAHIIPWRMANDAERISPTNGVCLCASHHRLFDAGAITIDPGGLVVCKSNAPGTRSKVNTALTTALRGTRARLPQKDILHPAPASMAHHYTYHKWSAKPWSLRISDLAPAPEET